MNGNIGKRTGALLLLILFCVIASTPASAYSYSGKKWAGTSATYGWNSSIPASWKPPINSAASAWNNAGSKFTFINTWSGNLMYKQPLSGNPAPIAQATTWSLVNIIYLAKIQFNSNYAWSTTTNGQSCCYDVQNIATHEFGHWLQLNDLYPASNSEKTMYGYANKGETKKRTLETDDKTGIKYIYGAK